MEGVAGLVNFATLAREFEVLPTEVSAIVIGSGARYSDHLGAKIVEPTDLPLIEPMLSRLRDHKRSHRPRRRDRDATR